MHRRSKQLLALVACATPLSGCEHSPDIDVLGSFFPVWIFCAILGLVFAAGVRLLLVRSGIQDEIGPRVLIYPSLAMLFTFGFWLTFFN